jgi:hypothetical protein
MKLLLSLFVLINFSFAQFPGFNSWATFPPSADEFKFQIINQQTTAGTFDVASGKTITIDWGDGTSNDYTGTNVAWTHTYTTYSGVTYNCKMTNASALTKFFNTTGTGTGISFDVGNLPRNVLYIYVNANNTISGSTSGLPPALITMTLSGANTLSGAISGFPSSMTNINYYHSNPTCGLYGAMGDFPSGLTSLAFNAAVGVTGDIAAIGNACKYVSFNRNSAKATYSTSAWPSTMDRVFYWPTAGNGLTSAEVDQILIDLAAYCTAWTGDKVVWLAGYNAPRTSASTTAVNTLTARGVAVTTNL